MTPTCQTKHEHQAREVALLRDAISRHAAPQASAAETSAHLGGVPALGPAEPAVEGAGACLAEGVGACLAAGGLTMRAGLLRQGAGALGSSSALGMPGCFCSRNAFRLCFCPDPGRNHLVTSSFAPCTQEGPLHLPPNESAGCCRRVAWGPLDDKPSLDNRNRHRLLLMQACSAQCVTAAC